MCKNKVEKVEVKIPADLSSTGKTKWKNALIDSCIAPIVDALQKGGIDMRGSCCGHDKCVGDIDLQDGRALIILNREEARRFYSHNEMPKFHRGQKENGGETMTIDSPEERKLLKGAE